MRIVELTELAPITDTSVGADNPDVTDEGAVVAVLESVVLALCWVESVVVAVCWFEFVAVCWVAEEESVPVVPVADGAGVEAGGELLLLDEAGAWVQLLSSRNAG